MMAAGIRKVCGFVTDIEAFLDPACPIGIPDRRRCIHSTSGICHQHSRDHASDVTEARARKSRNIPSNWS
ncbi:hypothetical protein AGR9A_Cc70252 [Agrobacterium salinitolerans str. Hayward 0363]|nr:hypothetical protein AGR9A_Cc70252 [Agrobacterium salinitolerans str. Hayward 0363]